MTHTLSTILDRLEHITEQVVTDFGGLSEAQLNWKANAKSWSIGQNLDHLITVNATYFSIWEEMLAGEQTLPWIAKLGFYPRMMGRMILKSVQPDRSRKIKTMTVWEPSASELPAEIIAQFTAHQQELAQRMGQLEDLLTTQALLSSPANPNIVYSLETALEIIVTHEERHLEQAREVKQSLAV